jgi:hypothetical protein
MGFHELRFTCTADDKGEPCLGAVVQQPNCSLGETQLGSSKTNLVAVLDAVLQSW